VCSVRVRRGRQIANVTIPMISGFEVTVART
jgi:hypothetical protein